jgi:hypothetical protein
MTEEDAVKIARSFAAQLGYSVDLESPTSFRMSGERFNRLWDRKVYPSDSWVVHFPKYLPPGVAAEDPATIMIEVLEATGQVRHAYLGMSPDWPPESGLPDA